MGFARKANAPVILIGDIDRGGVIAQIAGTKLVLDPDDAALVRGFIVNKFRGDLALFADGVTAIENIQRLAEPRRRAAFSRWRANCPPKTAWCWRGLRRCVRHRATGVLTIAVPLLPHIANFDDLDPLRAGKIRRALDWLRPGGRSLPLCLGSVLLPGSKATMADLAVFHGEEGWDHRHQGACQARRTRAGHLRGLSDARLVGASAMPSGVEGAPGETEEGAWDCSRCRNRAHAREAARQCERLAPSTAMCRSSGFEMHMGRTDGNDCARPLLIFADGREDGAISPDGRIAGTYVHGFFNDDAQRRAFIEKLGGLPGDFSYEGRIEEVLDALAAHLETHLDLDRLLSLAD